MIKFLYFCGTIECYELSGQTKTTGIIDTLPIRGGEQVFLVVEDNQKTPNKLSFKTDTSFYVNRVRDIDPGTQKDVYSIDLCTFYTYKCIKNSKEH